MEIPIQMEGFEDRGLKLRTAGFFSGPKLIIDGQEIKGKRKRYQLRDNHGNQVECQLRFNGLDPVPKVEVGGHVLNLARPISWYEYIWISLPVVLVFGGGALGVLCGLPAIYSSARIFRTERSSFLKYLSTGGIAVGALLAYILLVVVFNVLAETYTKPR